jgi:hypothetical protein
MVPERVLHRPAVLLRHLYVDEVGSWGFLVANGKGEEDDTWVDDLRRRPSENPKK